MPPDRELTRTVPWNCPVSGEERHARGRRYLWDNRDRRLAAGMVQATLEGEIDVTLHGRGYVASPGTLMVLLYGEDSRYGRASLERPYRCVWVQLEGAGVTEHLEAIRGLVGPVLQDEPGGPLTAELRQLHASVSRREPDAALPIAAAAHRFVLSLYESAARQRRRGLAPVERAIERLVGQPLAPESVEQVADRFGVSREHLTRAFTRRVGTPPGRYLTDARVQHALRLLQATDLPVAEVARRVGLGEGAALARHVKRVTGHTPRDFRAGRRG